MPIRWEPADVLKAMDAVEAELARAAPHLARVRELLLRADSIPNLSQYVTQHMGWVQRDLDHLLHSKVSVEGVHNQIPKAERATAERKRDQIQTNLLQKGVNCALGVEHSSH